MTRAEARALFLFERDRFARYFPTVRVAECTLTGIVRHELGHAADPTPDEPEAEARADAIVAWVCGEPVRYDSRGVQTIGRGGRRPRRLHR